MWKFVLSLAGIAGGLGVAADAAPTSRNIAVAPGVQIHVLEAGAATDGAPTLVFVPGWRFPEEPQGPGADAIQSRVRVA